jgi:DNA-binding transcriptional ArsR family regulator
MIASSILPLHQTMPAEQVVRGLSALAQSARLEVFRMLVQAGRTGLLPTEMAEALGLSPSALSFHLKELLHAQLVTQERQGRSLVYRAHFEQMNSLIGYLTENCCAGEVCEASAVGEKLC